MLPDKELQYMLDNRDPEVELEGRVGCALDIILQNLFTVERTIEMYRVTVKDLYKFRKELIKESDWQKVIARLKEENLIQ